MIELCCEYLSVQCIWLYVVIMSRTSFWVNLHSIVCLNVKKLLARSRHHIWSLSDSDETQTHLASLAKWLSVRLRTKWPWVRISLLSPIIISIITLSLFLHLYQYFYVSMYVIYTTTYIKNWEIPKLAKLSGMFFFRNVLN